MHGNVAGRMDLVETARSLLRAVFSHYFALAEGHLFRPRGNSKWLRGQGHVRYWSRASPTMASSGGDGGVSVVVVAPLLGFGDSFCATFSDTAHVPMFLWKMGTGGRFLCGFWLAELVGLVMMS